MRIQILLLFMLFFIDTATAQIKGTVTDQSGEPLAFASVYVQGTTKGTTTNLEGEYFLELEKGKYQLVFQYIGFRQQVMAVDYQGSLLKLDVYLEGESISLMEIEVKANAEDPAYPIIRKAIAKRKYYKELVNSYSCDVYIKGNVKILEAPEKLLGQDVGDMEGSLDTNRQGIVYLSESVSKLYFKQPDRFKEIMTSSKVSGDDNGFSFNSAREMNIDLYDNLTQYGRNIISPIAEKALGHYKYRLEGVIMDEEGYLINKIEVIPKRSEDAAFQGFIYIVTDLWNIQSADIYVTGKRVQMPLFDTLYIKQTYVPVVKPDTWRIFSQTFSIKGGAFGFKFGGDFTGIFTNYDLAPGLGDKFFGNEIMKVEDGANEKDSTYWEGTRPVPLTIEESVDYSKKDSIKVVRESKPYLDSLDRENNKLKVADLLFGYTFQNSWEQRSFTIESPVNTIQFNAVQGGNVNFGLAFKQAFDKLEKKKLTIGAKVNYGFADEEFRAAGRFVYSYNPKKFSRLRVFGGQKLAQFNGVEPISVMLNSFYSVFSKENHARFYDKKYLMFEHRQEVSNGILLFALFQFADRSPLTNNSDFSFFKKDKEFAPNVPINDHTGIKWLERNKAVAAGISVRFRFGQKYYDYPDRKYIFGSKFPDLWIHYRKGFSLNPGTGDVLSSDVDYDRISAVIQKRNVKMGLAGHTSFRLEIGRFINSKQLYFQDYKHFNGNEISVGNPGRYLYSFKKLPYYEFSTRDAWVEGHWEHNFQGFITDKLPLFKKLDWSMVAGANFLYTSEEKDYLELSLGFDQIGFGILRLLRFDVAGSFRNGEFEGLGYLIGVAVPVGDFEL